MSPRVSNVLLSALLLLTVAAVAVVAFDMDFRAQVGGDPQLACCRSYGDFDSCIANQSVEQCEAYDLTDATADDWAFVTMLQNEDPDGAIARCRLVCGEEEESGGSSSQASSSAGASSSTKSAADLAVSISCSPAGQNFDCTVSVNNSGPDGANNVVVNLFASGNAHILSIGGNAPGGPTQGQWSVGALAVGSTNTTVVLGPASGAGAGALAADVSASTADPVSSNNSDTTAVNFSGGGSSSANSSVENSSSAQSSTGQSSSAGSSVCAACQNICSQNSSAGGTPGVEPYAECVSLSMPDYIVNGGNAFTATVVMKNTSGETWNPGEHALTAYWNVSTIWPSPWPPSGTPTFALTQSVPPDGTATFNVTFSMSVPVNSGGPMIFQMISLVGESRFGSVCGDMMKSVTSVPPPGANAAECEGVFVPSNQSLPGQSIRVMMRNTGQTTWTPNPYYLRVGGDSDLYPLPQATAPGQTVTVDVPLPIFYSGPNWSLGIRGPTGNLASTCPWIFAAGSNSSSADPCQTCVQEQCGTGGSSSAHSSSGQASSGTADLETHIVCSSGTQNVCTFTVKNNGPATATNVEVNLAASGDMEIETIGSLPASTFDLAHVPVATTLTAGSTVTLQITLENTQGESCQAPACFDADGGDNPADYGTVTFTDVTFDECADQNTIREAVCPAAGSLNEQNELPDFVLHACPAGTQCQNGVCQNNGQLNPPAGTQCVKSDSNNILVQGVGTRTPPPPSVPMNDSDFCTSADTLGEIDCSDNASLIKWPVKCPPYAPRCVSGACQP